MAIYPAAAHHALNHVPIETASLPESLGSRACISSNSLSRTQASQPRRRALERSTHPARVCSGMSTHSASNAQGVQRIGHGDPSSVSHASVYQPASLSRVFIGVQPGRGVAKLTKIGKPSGPMSLVLLLFTVAGTISAAVRSRLEAAARGCSTCHGYGINRCTLCSGTGAVGWEGKWNHKEPCPMCLGKRFVDCPECGGHFHRRIFSHHHHTGLTVTELVEAEQGMLAKLGD